MTNPSRAKVIMPLLVGGIPVVVWYVDKKLYPGLIKSSISFFMGFVSREDSKFHDSEMRKRRERTELFLTADGSIRSITTSLMSDMTQFQAWKPKIDALKAFVEMSGFADEISPAVSTRLMGNMGILATIQQYALGETDRRDEFVTSSVSWTDLPSWDEALRYSKYAVAAYGESIIKAAEIGVSGSTDLDLGFKVTIERVSAHVGVQKEDIVIFDIEATGKADYIRHFLAVDHVHRKIVLAIRGTASVSEVITDISGFTRPFCGGQAHADISLMAEQLWGRIGDSVISELEKHKDYELIVCGHSLGGGVANALNILLHEQSSRLIKGRAMRCFSYASPPVFAPLELVPEAVAAGVNYIHEMDVVPFLQAYSVRHLLNTVVSLEEGTKDLGPFERTRLMMGHDTPSEELVEQVNAVNAKDLPPIDGMGMIAIPVAASVWLQKKEESEQYDAKICDSMLLAASPIYLHPDRYFNHFTPRYEFCLSHVDKS